MKTLTFGINNAYSPQQYVKVNKQDQIFFIFILTHKYCQTLLIYWSVYRYIYG